MSTAGSAWRAAIWVLTIPMAVLAGALSAQEYSRVPAVYADVNKALETQRTGEPYRWTDPRSGQSGTIVVDRTYYRSAGTPCRDYTRTLEAGGAVVSTTSGTGCRLGKGVWSLTERPPVRTTERTPERTKPSPAPEPRRAIARPRGPAASETAMADIPATPAFTLSTPVRKPVLISGSLPTPSEE